MMSFLPILVALGLAAPASTTEQSPAVSIDIDVSAMDDPDEAEIVEGALRLRQIEVLEEGGLVVADDADTTIRVTVSRWGDGGINYRFRVEVFEAGHDEATFDRTTDCEACMDSRLYDKVSQEVARVSGRLTVSGATQEPEPESTPDQPPSETDPATPEAEQAPAEPPLKFRRVGGAGWTGLGLGVAGLGMTVAGAVILTSPRDSGFPVGSDRRNELTGYRPPTGAVVLGVGVTAAVAGVVLLIVDQTVLVRRRRDRARSTAVAPFQLQSGLGLNWTVRF